MKQIFTLALITVCISLSLHTKAQESEPTLFYNHILFFQGSVLNSKITLSWNVDKNETYQFFEVEKSSNGKEFATAAIMLTSEKSGVENYTFKSNTSSEALIYYRLKLVNNHNAIGYSKIITVKPSEVVTNRSIAVLQNPVQERLQVNYSSLNEGAYQATIYNTVGVKLYSTPISCYKGLNKIQLSTSNLAKGSYILNIENKAYYSSTKFIKN